MPLKLTAAECRDKAAKCNLLAVTTDDPDVAAELFELAKDYVRMARELEGAPKRRQRHVNIGALHQSRRSG